MRLQDAGNKKQDFWRFLGQLLAFEMVTCHATCVKRNSFDLSEHLAPSHFFLNEKDVLHNLRARILAFQKRLRASFSFFPARNGSHSTAVVAMRRPSENSAFLYLSEKKSLQIRSCIIIRAPASPTCLKGRVRGASIGEKHIFGANSDPQTQ